MNSVAEQTILVADDDEHILELVSLYLRRAGYGVITAKDGDEALARERDHRPDLLILDVMMEQPDDGIAMAQELRRSGWSRPIVMLTSIGKVTGLGYGVDPDVLPVDAFLEKPVRPAVLVKTVTDLLARAGGKEESHAGHGTTSAAR